MKKCFYIICCLSIVFKMYSQDSSSVFKYRINEIQVVATYPIIPFYNFSTQQSIVFAVLKNDDNLHSLLENGYSDTSTATKNLKPIDYYGGASVGGNVGFRGLINLNKLNNKLYQFLTTTLLFEAHNYNRYYLGRKDVKRIDTVFSSGQTIYLDSISAKAASFSLYTKSVYGQFGWNIESGNQYFKFSTGITLGLGLAFKNELNMVRNEVTYIKPSNSDNKYFQNTDSYLDEKVQRVNPMVQTRILIPFCMKLNFKKSQHFGVMCEATPGYEMNQLIKGPLLTRALLFCSLGIRYRV